MRAASADIPLQSLHNFQLAGIAVFLEQRDAADDHSRRAVRALKRALIEECLLHRVKLAVLFEAFNGDDRFSGCIADGELAGTPWPAVHKDGASAALAFATTIFGSGEAEFFAQRKQ